MKSSATIPAIRASQITGSSAPNPAAAWPNAKLPKKPTALETAHTMAYLRF